ncbi:MAG: hypothetical protein JXA06_07745 [Bacteroidetes bacterium]|nr:hypothetical protein [Bacteroidota bacterium]
MEPIILNLRPVQWPTFKRCFITVVILFIITSIILMSFSIIPVDLFYITTIILLTGQAVINWQSMKFVELVFDEKGITGMVNPGKKISLQWEQIAGIDIRTLAMDIKTRDGQTEHIDLGEISYEQHKSVKPRIIDLAVTKGIDVKLPR